MNSPVLIHCALHAEAKPLIDYFKLKKTSNSGSFPLYSNDSIHLVVSGIGMIRTATALGIATGQLCSDRKLIIVNVGIAAGSIEHNIGDLAYIEKSIDRLTGKEYYPDIIITYPGKAKTVETHSKAVGSESEMLNSEHLADMELSTVFEAGKLLTSSSRIHSLKVTSDHFSTKVPSFKSVSELIEVHKIPIVEFINELAVSHTYSRSLFSTEEDELLSSIRSKLQLTHSQELHIQKQARRFKCLNGSLPHSLDCFLDVEVASSLERSNIFKKLSESFAAK